MEVNKVDKPIFDLLKEMNKEMSSMRSEIGSMKSDMKSMQSEMGSMRSEMNSRFDTIESKLDGVGSQFELTNEARMNEVGFVIDKVNKIEKDVYLLKNRDNN